MSLRQVLVRLVRPLGAVTETGWSVLGLGLLCRYLAERYQWAELRLLGLAAFALVAVALVLTLVPRRVRAEVHLRPPRVVVGEVVRVRLDLHGRWLRLLPPTLDVSIGDGPQGSTRRTASSVDGRLELDLPSERRGVVEVGPASLVRADPLGIIRRRRVVSGTVELFVRPRTVQVAPLSSGIVHDLEGVDSNKLAASDLSFHALREYQPGDDPRHVHWKSTARAGELLVRQFHLTRRSHATVLLDPSPGSYAGSEEFELAVSVAASMGLRAVFDDFEVSFASGRHALTTRDPHALLDLTCRVGREGGSLAEMAAHVAADTSVVVVVSGSSSDPGEQRRVLAHFPSSDSLAVRVDLAGEPAAARSGTQTSLVVTELGQLAPLLLRASR
jgi:uncharacterized protein (DUF58 family)